MDHRAYKDFIHSKNSHTSNILDFTNPIQSAIDRSGLSTLSFYEQFYIGMGTDYYKSIVNSGGPVSDALLAHHFEGRGDYRVNTVGELIESMKSTSVYKTISNNMVSAPTNKQKGYTGMGSENYRKTHIHDKAITHCDKAGK